ncbi:MAG: histone deacetylase [Deltaproteobacteria bacterium]|nr:histone deacetylase [Deltaproteobacteria bacterium]
MIASFLDRRRARRRLAREVSLYYHPGYGAEALGETARAVGIDAFRGETLLGTLARERLVRPEDLRVPRAISLPSLRKVHSEAHLEAVTHPETLARIFGLPTEMVRVDALLRSARLACGGTVSAARSLIHTERTIAVNLGGGFHHAEPEQGSGFCIYNDVAAAIHMLRDRAGIGRVAIVDLDYHQGNGNLVAFAADEEVLTLSVHGSVWTHVEAVADLSLELPPGTGDAAYLAALEEVVLPALERHAPELVFYIAGNDVLAGDRLGDFALTLDGVFERDRRVVECCRRLGRKLVITLGGGYQRLAVEGWARLLRWILTDRPVGREASTEDPRQRFKRVFRSLEPGRLQTEASSGLLGLRGLDAPLQLDLSDVLDDLSARPPAQRFLDFYTLSGMEYALERYGILDQIRERGYRDLQASGDFADRGHQILRLHGVGKRDPERARRLLVELVAYRASLPAPPGDPQQEQGLEVLWVEWLLLQDPMASFSLERPPLPGQQHPGLGISEEVLIALSGICVRLGFDGLLHRPAHYHNALVGSRHFRFLDPEMEGRFAALKGLLAGLDLGEASRAVDQGEIRLGDGRPLVWDAAHFYLPVSRRLREFFESEAYRQRSEAARVALLEEGLHRVEG